MENEANFKSTIAGMRQLADILERWSDLTPEDLQSLYDSSIVRTCVLETIHNWAKHMIYEVLTSAGFFEQYNLSALKVVTTRKAPQEVENAEILPRQTEETRHVAQEHFATRNFCSNIVRLAVQKQNVLYIIYIRVMPLGSVVFDLYWQKEGRLTLQGSSPIPIEMSELPCELKRRIQ